jgi:cullin 1
VPSLVDKKVDVIPGEERKETVDAAIVRIMKARKQMYHADLVQEVLLQIKFFRPDPRLIKSRIDTLMNVYIRREDPMSISSPYVYVAGED